MSEYTRIRVNVRSICIQNDKMLFQRDNSEIKPVYATIGGEVEPGDKLEDRLKLEYMEETGEEIEVIKYLFVIENFYSFRGKPTHSLEHYFLVKIASNKIIPHEPNLSFHWIPIEEIKDYDLKPIALKEIIMKGDFERTGHLISE